MSIKTIFAADIPEWETILVLALYDDRLQQESQFE
jgi:hypothetical protein